jgi:protoheme IX farnesyltransferase
MSDLMATASMLKENYWPLIKSRQTFLLTLTGVAGYLCQPPVQSEWWRFSGLVVSLLITISGCTVLNMLFDRDIDLRMVRTSQRPLATGQVNPRSAGLLGSVLITLGLIWSAMLSMEYFLIILAGAGLNVLVYTLWLKRRSAWSIVFGGLAGGMPILAGRTLAMGHIDPYGQLLALVILCWIPSHNLTFSMLYSTDYINAAVPTFPSVYGGPATRFAIMLSSLLTASAMITAWANLEVPMPIVIAAVIASLGLLGIALIAWKKPSHKFITIQYKYSSLYMLLSMILLVVTGIV